ncbi:MAG TPA: uroporphyrinogen-III C-methyltransferase [Burkholderiaceae bacterium]|nr:uroporphyrinogen-III C-methyltransferase [Burkholderiaceae bacterium]
MTDDSNASMTPPPSPPMAVVPPAVPAVVHAAPHAPRYWQLLAWIAAVAFGVMSVAAFVSAWHTQQRVKSLEQELVRRQQTSQVEATEAKVAAKQALDSVRDLNGKVGVLDERVAESQMQRSQVEDLIQSLSRSRDENVLADVEASVRVAMQQAALTGSTDPIVSILKQSDERLARYNNPRLERVRRAIARDLDRVRTASAVDVPSLTIRLDEAVRMVDELPLVSTPERATAAGRAAAASAPAVRAAARAASAASAVPGVPLPAWVASLEHAWEGFTVPFLTEMKQAVRVTSIEHPEAALMTPEQSFFLRENLKLRLLNARLAILSRQFDLSQADLQQAQTALDRYFDHGSRRVVAVSELLRQVSAQAKQVSFPRPDDTLAAISAAVAGH